MAGEWFVTFGQRYAHETHPRFPEAHPDGWLVVEADDYDDAREITHGVLGPAWVFIVDLDDFDASRSLYPRGEIGRAARDDRGRPCFIDEP